MRHREICNEGNIMKEFYTGELAIVRKQVKSSRKNRIAHLLLFKTKGLYKVLEKDIPSSYWLQCFPCFDGPGRPGR